MYFECSIDINMPIDQVVKAWKDDDLKPSWQDGFLGMQIISGERYEVGGQSRIFYKHGKSEMELIETVLENNLPYLFKGLYEHEHMDNYMTVRFEELEDGKTKYRIEIDYFKFKSLMPKMMALVMPKFFKKPVEKWMLQFKQIVEETL